MRLLVDDVHIAEYKRKNENEYKNIEIFLTTTQSVALDLDKEKSKKFIKVYYLPETEILGFVDYEGVNVNEAFFPIIKKIHLFKENEYIYADHHESNIDIGKEYSLTEIIRMFNDELLSQYGLLDSIGNKIDDLNNYIMGYTKYLDITTIQKFLNFARDYYKQLGFGEDFFIKYVDSNKVFEQQNNFDIQKK